MAARKKAAPKPTGRPTLRTEKVVDQLCARLSDGETLRSICADESMPAWRTVYKWIADDADLSARIARARELGFDAIASDCLEIADDRSEDYTEGPHGPVLDTEHVSRSKLRIETRLKLLAKWDPKRYGDKVQTELTGADGGPLQVRTLADFYGAANKG